MCALFCYGTPVLKSDKNLGEKQAKKLSLTLKLADRNGTGDLAAISQ